MKKNIIFLFILCFNMIALKAEYFEVIEAEGEIRFRDPLKLKYSIIEVGDKLKEHGKLSLQNGQSLKLKTPMGDLITFKDKSYIKLKQIDSNLDQTNVAIQMYRGFGNFKVKPLGKTSSFIVRTPSAVAGVRGTEFNMNNGTLTVIKDQVFLEPINGNSPGKLVSEGESAKISSSGKVETYKSTEQEQSGEPQSSNSETQTTDDQDQTSSSSNEDQSQQLNQIQREIQQNLDNQEAERLIKLKLNINDID